MSALELILLAGVAIWVFGAALSRTAEDLLFCLAMAVLVLVVLFVVCDT